MMDDNHPLKKSSCALVSLHQGWAPPLGLLGIVILGNHEASCEEAVQCAQVVPATADLNAAATTMPADLLVTGSV